MLNPIKTCSIQFISDGIADVLSFDTSLEPVNGDFAGNLPTGLFQPTITATGGATVPQFAAVLSGTTVTVTFNTPPPQLDPSNNPVTYTLNFGLVLPN